MKLFANGFDKKIAKWWDPISNNLLVFQDLWGRKEAGAVSRSIRQCMDSNNIISQLTGAKFSRMSQAYMQSCCQTWR